MVDERLLINVGYRSFYPLDNPPSSAGLTRLKVDKKPGTRAK